MTTTLIFLAILLGIFLGWIVRQSINVQPWTPAGPQPGDRLPPSATAARVGLGVFLTVVTSFFMLSISAYNMRMQSSGDWIPLQIPGLVWVNTLLLVLGSVALQWAWNSARRGDLERLRTGLLAGGACTMAFIAGQLLVWYQLRDAGFYLTSNPANSFFFLITALHGLHMLGGMVGWVRALRRVSRGDAWVRIRPSVELCALYWHFLLLVWLVLLGLLFST